jgi:glycosyltransferase involved in cell wall biosynthesis
MEVERKHGFRSSFNFVPEGEYRVPDSLRKTLGDAGFEVGVHGLEHDGKLYRSKSKFAQKAIRIREYVQQWNASGFRSPLMQHKLGWIHQLGVEYDASTFDTDPFEPQSDGTGTIFPFWVPSSAGSGYVELPYTLTQDSTLFTVLGEPNIDIWKDKVDWIAEHGGMALLNTHPDYICFEGAPRRNEFPLSHYEDLLTYLKAKYEGQFWSALPRDVARFYRSALSPGLRNTRRKICMVTHSVYDGDNRVRRYAEALAKSGDLVDVIALAGENGALGTETLSGVEVHRVQRRVRNERTKWTYARRLLRFFATATVRMARLHTQNQYDLIHVHNIPDFLVFSAWYPKRTGAKLVLDIHDLVPEFFASKFKSNANGIYTTALRKIEKASVEFVDHVIISNHLWQDTLISRSVSREKCSVFLNHVDPAIFYRRLRTRGDGKFIIVFPGSFQWHQGLDIGIRAFAHVKEKMPQAEFHLYGGGDGNRTQVELMNLANDLGLNGSVKFRPGVPLDQMPQVLADADLGVVPKRADSFGNEAYSTKIMEFMSQGVPVVVSRTKIDELYFADSDVRFFTSGDDRAMAEAILDVIANEGLRHNLVARGHEYVERHGWGQHKQDYFALVDSILVERFPVESA